MDTLRDVIIQYLTEKGLEYKEVGSDQLALKICPSCADEKFHLYMNQDGGLWDCKKCGSKGNLNQFRELLGDVPMNISAFSVGIDDTKAKQPKTYRKLDLKLAIENASRLWTSKTEFANYLLNERKIEKDTLLKFKIGATDTHITIPIFAKGSLVNMRYRRNPKSKNGDKYLAEKGCRSMLFNGDVLASVKQVYVTEGEFDALQLIQRGITNTVSITLGASSFPKHWIKQFEGIQEIVLLYDNDEAGIIGAKSVAEKLGKGRCVIVNLPAVEGQKKQDVTDYFLTAGNTKETFLELVNKAKRESPTTENDVKHISEFNIALRDRLIKGDHLGIPTGYAKFDEAMGGLREGRMIVLSGLTNCGKSSFAINICLNLAEADVASFYFSLEMPPIDIVKKLLMLKSKLTGNELNIVADPSTELTKIDDTLTAFGDMPIYLYSGSGVVALKILEDTLKYAVEKYKVRVVFVDHLHYFTIGNSNNVTAETSKAVRTIKQLAMRYSITIVLLTHLNRAGRAKQRTGMYVPALSDLKDSGTTEQDADQVVFVCRDSESETREEREKTIIKIAKNRDGQAGGRINMSFSEDITTFIETAPGIEYSEQKESVEEQSDVLKMQDLPF